MPVITYFDIFLVSIFSSMNRSIKVFLCQREQLCLYEHFLNIYNLINNNGKTTVPSKNKICVYNK